MPKRLAACSALVVFALCLILGIRADNTFSTTVTRALVALAGTFAVGLALGVVAERMLDENVRAERDRRRRQQQPDPDGGNADPAAGGS